LLNKDQPLNAKNRKAIGWIESWSSRKTFGKGQGAPLLGQFAFVKPQEYELDL